MNEYFTSIGPDLAAKVPVIDIEPESFVDSSRKMSSSSKVLILMKFIML